MIEGLTLGNGIGVINWFRKLVPLLSQDRKNGFHPHLRNSAQVHGAEWTITLESPAEWGDPVFDRLAVLVLNCNPDTRLT